MSRQSWAAMEPTEVKITSRHHPATPHFKKFLLNSFILFCVFMETVCAGQKNFIPCYNNGDKSLLHCSFTRTTSPLCSYLFFVISLQ